MTYEDYGFQNGIIPKGVHFKVTINVAIVIHQMFTMTYTNNQCVFYEDKEAFVKSNLCDSLLPSSRLSTLMNHQQWFELLYVSEQL